MIENNDASDGISMQDEIEQLRATNEMLLDMLKQALDMLDEFSKT